MHKVHKIAQIQCKLGFPVPIYCLKN